MQGFLLLQSKAKVCSELVKHSQANEGTAGFVSPAMPDTLVLMYSFLSSPHSMI